MACWSHLSNWFVVFAPIFWVCGGDLWRPFAALWMQIGWGLYLQVVGTPNHYLLSSNVFDSEVVGNLKPSITCPHPCHSPSPQGSKASPPQGVSHLVKLLLPDFFFLLHTTHSHHPSEQWCWTNHLKEVLCNRVFYKPYAIQKW